MKALHDEAIFGVSSHSHPLPVETGDEAEGTNHGKENVETDPTTSLLSNEVILGELSDMSKLTRVYRTSIFAGFNHAARLVARSCFQEMKSCNNFVSFSNI